MGGVPERTGEGVQWLKSRRGSCTRRWLAAVVVFVVLVAPAPAQADGIFTAFGGASSGSDQSERVTTWGLSLAAMAGGVFGFELDFGRTAKAETDTVFVLDGRTTTLTGNIIVGAPLGAVRPYAVGGLGLVRTDVGTADGMTGRNDGLGVDIGGGLMGLFGDHVGVRIDLRYFRAVSAGEDFLDFEFENLDFVRFTGGVILRF